MTDLERFQNPLSVYGHLVRSLRMVRGVTLYEMAQALNVTPAYLSARETKRIIPSDPDVYAAAAYLQINVSLLMTAREKKS